MSVNLTVDGNTYEDAQKIEVGGKEITISESGTIPAPTAGDVGKVVKETGGVYSLEAQTAMASNITVNDTYDTTNYNSVTVAVPSSATLGTKNITVNGTYNASADNYDGYSQVTVSVSGGGGGGSSNTPVADATVTEITASGGNRSFEVTLSKAITKGILLLEPDSDTLSDTYADTSTTWYMVSLLILFPVVFANNGTNSMAATGYCCAHRGSTSTFTCRTAASQAAMDVTISGTTITVTVSTNATGSFLEGGTYKVKVWELADS